MRRAVLASTAIALALPLTTTSVDADVVEVVVTGEVEYNQINPPPLGNVMPGDPATLRFTVNSNTFTDSMNFPVRGYDIDESSFTLDMGGTTMTLQNPFPAGMTPYFSIRNNDPAVDGFFVSTNIDFPVGVPINQNGIFEQFRSAYSVGYDGGTLDSLDILDALGTYDFTGLTNFNWTVDDGPFNPLGLIFEQMTISVVGECFLVVGSHPGVEDFNAGVHTWTTLVSDIDQFYPVLLDDTPEFVVHHGGLDPILVGGDLPGSSNGAPSLGGFFSVQVVMWNPEAFPGQPEQVTHGLFGYVWPDGRIVTRSYGTGTGMQVWAETGVNERGQTVVRFPFNIPGFGD